MNSLRRTFGIAEPVRRGMELKIARAGEWRPAALGRSAAVSSDILAGRDTEISWEDVYSGMSNFAPLCFHGLPSFLPALPNSLPAIPVNLFIL